MVHLSEEELADWLDEAANKVTVGGLYKHYKSPVHTYKVTGLAIIEATNEPAVVYQAQYGRQISFVRPFNEWVGEVEQAGRMVPRFSPAN